MRVPAGHEQIGVVPPAGPHGGDGPAVARALGLDPSEILDLSQTLNPFAPDVASFAAAHLDELGRYPAPSAASEALADALGTTADRVLVTNGGAEAIALVAAEIGGGVQGEPEFSLHPRSPVGPRWRSDPHSPSGVLSGPGDSADVWDEAFYPLATGRWTAGRDRNGSTVTVGSLTKLFACPGLRLGYVVADEVERFARRQPAWSVSSLALSVLGDLLDHADLGTWQRRLAEQRADLVAVVRRHGFSSQASDAPWVLVVAPGLREPLARRGIVVRDCISFGLADTVRIAVPDDAGLERLAAALDEVTR